MNAKGFHKVGFLAVLATCFLVAGCSAPRLPAYPAKPAENYRNLVTADGLQLAVEPLFDPQLNKTYFGTDLIEKKILPVFVLVHNLQAEGSRVVFSDQIYLRGLGGDAISADSRTKVAGRDQAIALNETSAVLGSVPVMLVALSQISDSSEIRRNFKAKAFQTNTLSVGEQAEGFVYFRLPENISPADNPMIFIEVLDLLNKTRQSYHLPININLEGER